ncbi:hypothetical protein [Cupriavidus basilensis]|uniref:hypothetical protein n=1 Tax=Cupriavidus basilensis TaxID=68895 RepID=UPI0039F6BBFD
MLSIEFVASVPKELDHPELNEDCFFADEDTGHFALSDGASESYDSQTWARLLTSRYVAAPEFTPDWVESAVDMYRDRFDFDSLSWSQQAAFDRGSFATLLTLACRSDSNELDVFSIGDCLAVHCVEGRMSDSFPFTQPEQFDARPELLSTRGEANAFVGQPLFYKNHTATWPFIPGAKVLLLTDALGQCLLRDSSGQMLRALLEVQELNEFERLVLALRATCAIRLDDTTLVRLTVGARVV